ncbi:hypothetical protein [Arthrobacter sp. StoSoilA2]|nr:hypothetical protein [Arthrobacter sp. StoSoilA2]
MRTSSCELRRIQAPLVLKPGGQLRMYEVIINTRILRCPCGFRMEIPD